MIDQISEQGSKSETPLKESVVLPQKLSNALGRGFRQKFEIDFAQIETAIKDSEGEIEYGKINPLEEKKLQDLKSKFDELKKFIERLEKSRKVRITGRNNQEEGQIFEFSEKMIDIEPQSGEIKTGQLTKPIINALNHGIRNPLMSLYGYADLLSSTDNHMLRKCGNAILEFSKNIGAKLDPFQESENNPIQDIVIKTNSEGITSINPVLTPH